MPNRHLHCVMLISAVACGHAARAPETASRRDSPNFGEEEVVAVDASATLSDDLPGANTEPLTGASSDEVREAQHPCAERARAHAITLARQPRNERDLPLVEPGATFLAEPMQDFDGDGQEDLDLTPSTGPWNHVWPHLLYGSRTCAYAGGVVDAELNVLRSAHHGFRDLESRAANGCAGAEFTETRYAFDGRGYKRAHSVTCYFCEDDPSHANPTNPAECRL